MTPDALKLFFDANAIIVQFLVGIVIKYVPAFAKVNNQAIGWINAVGYVLVHYFTPAVAHAAGSNVIAAIPDIGFILISALTSSMWARTAYETLGRPLLEHVLKLKKAVPAS